MKKSFLLLFILAVVPALAQTATLRFDNSIPSEYPETWKTFSITINGNSFYPSDTLNKKIKINKRKLDYCYAVMDGDTLFFLAKFRKDNHYIVKPGCCCAFFTLEAVNDDGRGTVTLHNKGNRDLALIVAEANIDTVSSGGKETLYAAESAMCFYKPASIVIAETSYYDTKYDYQSGKVRDEALKAEQRSLIKNLQWFHFLHAEKIVVEYDDKTGKSTLKLDGYLTKEELHKAIYGH